MLMKAYNKAFFNRNYPALQQLLAPDIMWDALGQQQIIGIQAVLSSIQQSPNLQSITIDAQFFHREEAAQFGTLVTIFGEKYHFADRYTLNKDSRIEKIVSLISL